MSEVDFLHWVIWGQCAMLVVAGYMLMRGVSLTKRQQRVIDEQQALMEQMKDVLMEQNALMAARGMHRMNVEEMTPQMRNYVRESLLQMLAQLKKGDH